MLKLLVMNVLFQHPIQVKEQKLQLLFLLVVVLLSMEVHVQLEYLHSVVDEKEMTHHQEEDHEHWHQVERMFVSVIHLWMFHD